jgi:hypothetical protein
MPITTITSGIKYIKISKTDLAGANRNSDLNSLQKLRLKYNDIGVIEYDIINISEFSDHYLYSVFANTNVSATDNEVLNYNFSTGGISFSPLNNVSPYGVIINWTPGSISNPLGYFQTYSQGSPFGGGAYTVGKAANTGVFIFATYTIGFLNPGDTISVKLISSIRGTLTSSIITSGNPSGTISFTLPNLYSGEIIRVELTPTLLPISGILTNASFNIIPLTGAQSVSPTLTILEPILPPNFYNSSCNAIINNATENRFSLDYLKVDYPYASITAQNTQAIINGSAVRAQVQDSNYTSLKHINPRYNGSRLTGAQLNEYTSGDISYGKTAVIEQNQKYFGYFDWVGAFEPELKGATGAHVIYLIDAQGNAIPTREDLDKGRYYDFVYNFERDKNALISLKVPEQVPSLKTMNGLKRVLYSGADITPIVHTDKGVNYITGENINIIVNFTFPSVNGGNILQNQPLFIVLLDRQKEPYDFPNDLQSPGVLAYKVLPTTFTAGSNFVLTYNGTVNLGQKLYPYVIWSKPSVNKTVNINFQIPGKFEINITESTNPLQRTDNPILDTFNGWNSLNNTNTPGIGNFYLIKQELIELQNDLSPSTLTFTEPSLNIVNSVSYPFWTSTGSNYIESSGSILNLSTLNSLASINYFNSIPFPLFNVGSTSFIQTNPNRDQTGYDEVTTPFIIEIGDQFRFGYDEDNVYTVVSQSFSFFGIGGVRNRIFFDQDISTSGLTDYELNRFLIRRVIPDPALIIFEYTKPQGIGADGFIYPAAIPDELENNIDKVQEKLKRDNVI